MVSDISNLEQLGNEKSKHGIKNLDRSVELRRKVHDDKMKSKETPRLEKLKEL